MASFVETGEIPQHLTCPVCFELPEAEVYQCRDGHMLCKICYLKVDDCPQCRIPFDKVHPIRCRPIEEVLKEFWTDCPFKPNGCSERVLKTNLERHVDECPYDFARFGELVNICKDMGYLTCDFKFNKENGKEAVDHLISIHGIQKTNTNFKMELQSFKESARGDSTGFTFWMPVVVELMGGFLVVMAVLNRRNASFTTLSIFLPDLKTEKQSGLQVEYSVQNRDNLEADIWKRKPILLQGNEGFLKKITFNLNSIGFIPHCCEIIESLLINVTIQGGPLEGGRVEKITCFKRIYLTLTESLTPEASARFDRLVASHEAKQYHKEIKLRCIMGRNVYLLESRRIFEGLIPEGLELIDLKWIATEFIFIAAEYGAVEAVKYLIERKVNFNICTSHNGSTPLHLTVMDEDKETGLDKTKLLVELGGADVNALDDNNNNVLHFSAQYGNCEFLEYFLQKGLGVNDKDVDGQTPLFSAVRNENEEVGVDIARRLLENGADAGITDKYGQTALDFAVSNGKDKVAELLRSRQ